MKPDVTGQLLFWDKGIFPDVDPKRHIIQVFGSLAMPPKIAELYAKDVLAKYIINGKVMDELLVLSTGVGMTEAIDKKWATHRMDQLMTAPIWRV